MIALLFRTIQGQVLHKCGAIRSLKHGVAGRRRSGRPAGGSQQPRSPESTTSASSAARRHRLARTHPRALTWPSRTRGFRTRRARASQRSGDELATLGHDDAALPTGSGSRFSVAASSGIARQACAEARALPSRAAAATDVRVMSVRSPTARSPNGSEFFRPPPPPLSATCFA